MTTTIVTERTDVEAIGPFDEELFNAIDTAGESTALRAKREEAFKAYRELPAPTARTEEWRRTDPALFPFARLERAPSPVYADGLPGTEWDDHFDVVVLVNDASYTIVDHSGVLRRGVTVDSLTRADTGDETLVRDYLQGVALPPSTDKFAALNQAFWNVGFCVHVADGVKLEKGILFKYAFQCEGLIQLPRLLVVLGEGGEVTVAEHYESPDEVTMAAVITKELYVGEGGRLRIVSLQEWGTGSFLVDNDRAHVARDAQVDWLTLNFGTKLSKMNFGSDVAGPGSSAELDGIFFASGDQHMDQKTLQIHSSPHTYSRLLYKGAVKDRGHSVYQGIIQAKPGAIDVDAYQTNNNLVLNDGAHADTIPGLLIDADDLKCSHGATIGNVDQEQVFYLRSRGLSEQVARRIVIMGYFEEIVDRIPYPFLRDRVHEQIEEKLGELD